MIELDNTSDPCAWGSHLPALLACLGATTGPVLEIGVGHFSTPALHAYCGARNRKLVSWEQDEYWLRHFKRIYECDWHVFLNGPYLGFTDITKAMTPKGWGVAFIDHSPGGQCRADAFVALIQESDYVVVHDYEKENEEAIAPMLGGLNWHVTKTYPPPTLVASYWRGVQLSILCL